MLLNVLILAANEVTLPSSDIQGWLLISNAGQFAVICAIGAYYMKVEKPRNDETLKGILEAQAKRLAELNLENNHRLDVKDAAHAAEVREMRAECLAERLEARQSVKEDSVRLYLVLEKLTESVNKKG